MPILFIILGSDSVNENLKGGHTLLYLDATQRVVHAGCAQYDFGQSKYDNWIWSNTHITSHRLVASSFQPKLQALYLKIINYIIFENLQNLFDDSQGNSRLDLYMSFETCRNIYIFLEYFLENMVTHHYLYLTAMTIAAYHWHIIIM